MQFSRDGKCWCLKCTSNHESDIIEHTGSLRTASPFIFLPSTGELGLSIETEMTGSEPAWRTEWATC